MAGEKRLLLLASDLDGGGMTTYTRNLCVGLARRGCRALLVAPSCAAAREIEASGVEFRAISDLDRSLWGFFHRRQLLRLARKFSPDAIHAVTLEALPQAEWLGGALGTDFVATAHSILPAGSIPVLPKRCRTIIAVSEAVRENLVNDLKVPKSKVAVVYNGVSVDGDDETLFRASVDHAVTVGVLGNLYPHKGFEYFIHAAKIVRERGVRAHFIVAGDGPQNAQLRELVAREGLAQDFTFSGRVNHPRRVLAVLDIFVNPALLEGLGITVIEAMERGKPVIVSGVGGLYSVVDDGQNGLIVPAKDVVALAEAIISLARDPERRIAMGRAGRQKVKERFSMEIMAQETERVYWPTS